MPTLTVARATDNRLARRSGRHQARRTLWAESWLTPVRLCMTTPVGGSAETGTVTIKASGSGADRRAGLSGLMRCGSVWSCPTCSHRVGSGRATEIAEAVTAWSSMTGGHRVALLTLTMRHRDGQSLGGLWDGLSTAWNKVTSGRGWLDDQALFGSPVARKQTRGTAAGTVRVENRVPYVRAVEVTHGDAGWHVHLHIVLFLGANVTGPVTEMCARSLAGSMFGRWSDSLAAQGFARPTLEHGVDVRLMDPAAPGVLGDYFTKAQYQPADADRPAVRLGMEAALGAHKQGRRGNRTPFQVLADVVAWGDADDLDLWHEWEQGSKGRRQITWSTGLRSMLALAAEATDAELVDDAELAGDVVVMLSCHQWSVVRWHIDLLLAEAEADDTGYKLRTFLRELLDPVAWRG